MAKSRFRTSYDGLNVERSHLTGCVFDPSEGLAQQNFARECDINTIMAKYRATGLVRVSANYARGEYADLSSAPDFHTAMNIVSKANEVFAELPSELRKRFNNDPSEFLSFVGNPKNSDEMVRLGLATRRVPAEPSSPPQGAVPPVAASASTTQAAASGGTHTGQAPSPGSGSIPR